MKNNLHFSNIPNIEKIFIEKDSLKQLKSLNICDCEKLKTIEFGENAFTYYKTFELKSVFLLLSWLDLRCLEELIVEDGEYEYACFFFCRKCVLSSRTDNWLTYEICHN